MALFHTQTGRHMMNGNKTYVCISFQDMEDEEDKRITEVEIVIKKSDSLHRHNSYDTLGEDNKAYVAPIYRCTSV